MAPAGIRRSRIRSPECWSRFTRCASGSSAIEFSALALPFLLLIVCIIQYYALHLMQSTLSDALYQSASKPEASLLTGSQSSYATTLCNKTAFPAICTATLKVELQPLQNAPTAKTAITGGTFNAGTSNDVLVLRASTQVVQFIPLIPILTAKASVVFRRPLP